MKMGHYKWDIIMIVVNRILQLFWFLDWMIHHSLVSLFERKLSLWHINRLFDTKLVDRSFEWYRH